MRAQDSVPVAAAAPPSEVTDAAPAPVEAAPVAVESAAAAPESMTATDGCAVGAEDLESDEEELAEGEGDDGEKETPDAVVEGPIPQGPVYSAEISDEELARRWKDEIASLGSMAVGFAHSGRLVNAKQFPQGEDWIVVMPAGAWATEETIDYLTEAIRDVRARFPNAPPLRVNGISHKEGGYMRPHKSHQNGRDVDVGFYYPTVDPIRTRAREHVIDVGLNWALIRSLLIKTDVQMILVDRRVRKVIYDYAVRAGEDKAWLDSIFNDGPMGMVRHARGHRDHFHIRFHNPRAQELGRRVQPFLSLQPEHNVTTHRIRNGDTLGGIALKYGSSVAMIKKANRMKNNFLRAGNRLSVPLRGPCTHCPVPPPFVLPTRRLPPNEVAPALVAAASKAPENDCARPASAEPAKAAAPVVGSASVEAAASVLPTAGGHVAAEVKPASSTAQATAATAEEAAPAVGRASVGAAASVLPAAGGKAAVEVKPATSTAQVAAGAVTPAAGSSRDVVPAVGSASVGAAASVLPAATVEKSGAGVKPAAGTSRDVVPAVGSASAGTSTGAVVPASGSVRDVSAPVKPAAAVNVASTVVPAAATQDAPAAGEPGSKAQDAKPAAAEPAPAVKPAAAPARESEQGAAGVSHGR
ncbi:penicillin-insensitive murein endopeptidase [Comamonas sp. JC664]|uniref:penicillin-insensitive murein endopeptidase n=1 Tax=Comamonas sp. JC664 TaxID=2801917 RepID=UPI00191F588F|nr:penicillin-insensitive murein endopeptidase [Comamonas sp. JC664]